MSEKSNFEFLKKHEAIFFELASAAERHFTSDPNATLIKLRQLGEAMAQELAVLNGIYFDDRTSQVELLQELCREMNLDPTARQLFHTLRVEGNKATHEFKTQHREALAGLKVARTLAAWFHKALGKAKKNFKLGAFKSPPDPSAKLNELHAEVTKLQAKLKESNQETQSENKLINLLIAEKKEYQDLANMMDKEAKVLAEQAKGFEEELLKQQVKFEESLTQLRAELEQEKVKDELALLQEQEDLAQRFQNANEELCLNEELTRIIIDQQLCDAGWFADTEEINYSKGSRPEEGLNKAIAQWPCDEYGYADYVLFAGLRPIAIIEAKASNVDVASKITEAEVFAKHLTSCEQYQLAMEIEGYRESKFSAEIPFVYSSNGRTYNPVLTQVSGTWFRDTRKSSNISRALESFHSPAGLLELIDQDIKQAEAILKQESFSYLKLRDYQENAIRSVEEALAQGKDKCLLSMATGTGKSKVIQGLIYRFLKARRFTKILLLVDRDPLVSQAQEAFVQSVIEDHKSLAENYDVAGLGTLRNSESYHLQIATVDEMIKYCFNSDHQLNIDHYDCIIVDEAHRCYNQELLEEELNSKQCQHYLSSYRRILDYFDAVKIGLTATVAKHISETFGPVLFTYSYREAVADSWLVDHEPAIRYKTLLSNEGIKLKAGQKVQQLRESGEIEIAVLKKELSFDLDDFNKSIIVPDFNRVLAEQLALEIDPNSEEKTIIFCASDLHADMLKTELDKAFFEQHGDFYDQHSVAKITNQCADVEALVKTFKTEHYPNIAITVDLLATGIDMPKVCHLVFMRRVRSRILFEQMIGRAARPCDEINKKSFKIYDPLGLQKNLESRSNISPVSARAKKKRGEAVILSSQEDQLLTRTQSFGGYDCAQDFLNSLHDFLRDNVDKTLALKTMVYEPIKLTREDLKEVRLLLDQNGYTETEIRVAWNKLSRHEIKANIVDYLRKSLLGIELKDFDDRVEEAMEEIYIESQWSPIQKRYLNKLEDLINNEIIIDFPRIDNLQAQDGGFERMNKLLNHQLTEIISRINSLIWLN